jgi:alpha-ketoglutarate-dependent taurine dioxygenase
MMAATLTPLGPHVGIEVSGLRAPDLADPQEAARCRRLVDERGVVVYREVGLDDDQLVAFSSMLGEVERPRSGALESHPEVAPVTRQPGLDPMAAYRAGTFFWHLDGANGTVPNKATLLAAEQVAPDDEGDTEFASTYAAYEHLPEEEKRSLDGVRVVHSFRATQRLAQPDASDEERARWDRVPDAEHPLVWVRRDGRRSMLVGSTTDHVVGMDPDEGRALLDRLLEWSTRPEFVVRHHWRVGDLVVWDNTGMLHRALPYGEDSPRLMHRTTIAGEEAIA